MGISGISNQNISQTYSYSASHNISKEPAQISIDSNKESQKAGYEVGINNAKDGSNLLNVADNALSSISDSLQRIRELSLQASNGTLDDSDKSAIQDEVSSLLGSIESTAKNTEYNTLKPLDGSMADINLATNPSGGGLKIQLDNTTLKNLGIDSYDVTSNFNIEDIDKAIEMVNKSRSSIGASKSAIETQINIGNTSISNIPNKDDIELEQMVNKVTEQNKNRVMEEYKNFALMSSLKEQGSNVEKLLQIK